MTAALDGYAPASPREEIGRTCRLLMAPGDVHEVRILHCGRRGTMSGYFNDHEALVDAVLPLDGTVPAIYITLNPVQPALLARAANRLQERAQVTTADTDVLRRRWMLLDFDPVRPSGISSTDREHGRAITCACGTWEDWRGTFGDPVVADSGNGCHLLYRVDLPNDAASTAKLKSAIAGVARFSAPGDIQIDLTVFNAARITKLYGTLARKGDNLPDRPHRRSRLLEAPGQLRVLGAVA